MFIKPSQLYIHQEFSHDLSKAKENDIKSNLVKFVQPQMQHLCTQTHTYMKKEKDLRREAFGLAVGLQQWADNF